MIRLKTNRRFISISLTILVIAVGIVWVLHPGQDAQAKASLNLHAPIFLTQVQSDISQPDATAIGSLLDQEAGISAYFYYAGGVDLAAVRTAFQTIELDTADYLIGSVKIPNYSDYFSVHVYVHKSGWFLAYYLRTDPTAKIIDIKASTIASTILETGLSLVANLNGILYKT